MDEARAGRALQLGFPATAVILYRGVLSESALTTETRTRVHQGLITALLDAGEVAAAEQELQLYAGPKDSPYRLRAALVAAQARRLTTARAEAGEVNVEDLPAVDRGWWFFLQAQLAVLVGDFARANGFFDQAAQAAVSDQQRARFALGQAQARLQVEVPTEAQLVAYRESMDRLQGTRQGYVWARTYATALHRLRRSAEAQAVLQRQLLAIPVSERNEADQLRMMLGMIAGEGSQEGRRAFLELVRAGQQPETQRTALQLLARGVSATGEAGAGVRAQLRQDLGQLTTAVPAHPIIEDILLVRAELALQDKQFVEAEDAARRLLENFPGSTRRADALGVRLSVAWTGGFFRAAADLISQLRAHLAQAGGRGREQAELGVLLAEAFFRAGDFQSAAEAYDAALRAASAPGAIQVAPAGVLVFQRVLSDIRADRLEAAATLLDESGRRADFEENRWQAEWNLALALQARGQLVAAQARVEQLLGAGTVGVPDALRVRLLWLRAKLSLENGQAEVAVRQADELLAGVAAAKLEPALTTEIVSTAMLLKGEALLKLGRSGEGEALLERLRLEHRGTPAAVYSYLVQATHLTAEGEAVKAQQLFIRLRDDYPQSEFAPLALYYAAVNAARRGLDEHLMEAYNLLEKLVQQYPRDPLVFYARLKQGDLQRLLNQFGVARQFYEDLINNYSQHPDVLRAQLSLADCLSAQADGSAVNAENAAALYERLRDLPLAPADLRVEAGNKWGYSLARRGQVDKAVAVRWSVVDSFLLDRAQAARLGPNGWYWLARTLLELGQAHEEAGRLDEAQRAYRLIVEYKLAGAAQAEARLARFRTPVPEGRP